MIRCVCICILIWGAGLSSAFAQGDLVIEGKIIVLADDVVGSDDEGQEALPVGDVVVDEADAEALAIEAQIKEEENDEEEGEKRRGIIGGFFEAIGNGFNLGGNNPRVINNKLLNSDISEIHSQDKLKELIKEFKRQPNVQAMAGQFEMKFKMMRDNELRLMHYVCNFKRSEFNSIQTKTKLAILRAEAIAYQNLVWATQGGRGKSKSTDPQSLLENEFMQIAHEELTERRANEYQREVEARRGFRKDAIVQSMTATLDRQLLLSAEQREEINNVLLAGWSDQWLRCIQYLSNNGIQYFPNIPKPAIRKVLNQGQVDLMASLRWQPQNNVFHMVNGNIFGFGQQGQGSNLENELTFEPETSPAESDEVDTK